MKIQNGEHYRHIRTGNVYVLINVIEMKHPETGEWIEGALYRTDPEKDYMSPRMFVRALESFKQKFELAK